MQHAVISCVTSSIENIMQQCIGLYPHKRLYIYLLRRRRNRRTWTPVRAPRPLARFASALTSTASVPTVTTHQSNRFARYITHWGSAPATILFAHPFWPSCCLLAERLTTHDLAWIFSGRVPGSARVRARVPGWVPGSGF